jgi:hypothetical protein
VSSYGGAVAPSPSASASAAPTWQHAAALGSYARANARRFPSAGHFFGNYDADIFVNDVVRETYASAAPGTVARAGAIVVEVLTQKNGEPGPVLAMERDDAGWTYLEMDSALHVRRRGRLSPCVECHMHVSSQDELFSVPTTGR